MVRTVLGRMKRVTQQPLARSGYSDPVLTSGYSRAGSGTVIDQQGNVLDVGANAVRRTSTQTIAVNLLRNPRFQGAVPGINGQGGIVPTNHGSFANNGLTYHIIGIGVDAAGRPYYDLRFFGTATGAFLVYAFDTTPIPGNAGDTFTGSGYLSLIGGSLSGITDANISIRQVGGATPTFQSPSFYNVGPSGRVAVTATLGAGATGLFPALNLGLVNGAAIDLTVRYAGMQWEPGSAANAQALPPAGTLGVSILNGYNRLLIEPSATNQAVNSLGNAMVNGGAHVAAVSTDYVPPYPTATVYKGTKQAGVGDTNFCNTAGGTYAANAQLAVSCWLLIPMNNTATVANISQDSNTGVTQQRGYDMSRKGTWQRIYTALTAGATANAGFQLRISGQADGDVHYRCMLQIENGFAPTSYIPTSAGAVARALDGYIVPLGAWYFDQAKYTNLIQYSNFNPVVNQSVVGGTLTNNATAGPFGGTVANTFVVNASGGAHSIQQANNLPYIAGQPYTYSVYLKALNASYRYVHMRLPVAAFNASDRAIIFDLQTGTIVVKDPTVTARVSTLPGGWFRVIMTQTAAVSAIAQTVLVAVNATNDGTTNQQSFTADGVGGFQVYGAQIVQSTAAGPYIDNPGTTLNTKAPSDNFSFLFRGVLPVRPYQGFTGIMAFDNQTFDNRLYIYADTLAGAGTQVWMTVAYGGTYNGPYPVGTLPAAFGTEFSVNIAVTLTQVRVSVNGGTVFTLNTPVPVNAFTKYSPGSIDLYPADGSAFNGEVTRVEYVPYVMTDTQLMSS